MLHKAQFEYNDQLAAMCGPDVPRTSSWRIKMYDETGLRVMSDLDAVRPLSLTLESCVVQISHRGWALVVPLTASPAANYAGRIRRADAAGYRDGPFLPHDEAPLLEARKELGDLAAQLGHDNPAWRAS